MSSSNTSKEHFFTLLESAEIARNQEILDRATEATASDRELDVANGIKNIVVRESIWLADRLDYLSRHPKLPSFLGGSAIKVYKPPKPMGAALLSEPVMGTAAEHDLQNSIQSYFQFGVTKLNFHRKSNNHKLKIYSVISEEGTGKLTREELYRITASHTESKGFWNVEGKELDRYASTKRHETSNEFSEKYPWYKDYMVFRDGDWAIFPDFDDRSLEGSERYRKQAPVIQHELISRLDPGPHSWDYPEELYHFPLGLLMQANQTFGTKQK